MTQGFKLALGRQGRDRIGAFALWRTVFAWEPSAMVCTRGSHLAICDLQSWAKAAVHPRSWASQCPGIPHPAQTFPTHQDTWRRSQNQTGLSLFQPLCHPFHVLTNARGIFSYSTASCRGSQLKGWARRAVKNRDTLQRCDWGSSTWMLWHYYEITLSSSLFRCVIYSTSFFRASKEKFYKKSPPNLCQTELLKGFFFLSILHKNLEVAFSSYSKSTFFSSYIITPISLVNISSC